MKKFLETILAKMAGMDATTVASLLNDDGTLKPEAENTILSAHAARIKKINDDHASEITELETKIPARVKAEVLEELENNIKTTFGLKSDKRGLELVKDLISVKTKSVGKDQMTEAEILTHPVVLALTDKHATEIKNLTTEKENALKAKDQEYEQGKVLELADSRIVELIEASGAVLPDASTPEGKAKRQNQINLFKLDIKNQFKFQKFVEGDVTKLIPIGKDGKPATDAHGNRIDFETLVSNKIPSMWDIKQAEPKGAPAPAKGGNQGGETGAKKYSTVVTTPVTNKDEYIKGLETIRSADIPAADKSAAQLEFVKDFSNLA